MDASRSCWTGELPYPIRSALDPDYVTQLAGYVDGKIRAAGESAPSSDPLRLAVLAALNIADELFRHRDCAPVGG